MKILQIITLGDSIGGAQIHVLDLAISLHKRGHKQAIGKAPLRETLASLILRRCGFDGRETVVDPMCGSGSFVLEAAERATGLQPGRSRRFAFELLPSFEAKAWSALRDANSHLQIPANHFYGYDRDAGAIAACDANAARAGVADCTSFKRQALSDLKAPAGPAGLVIVNPPYGQRIGEKKQLFGLYGALGKTLMTEFSGWRVGLVTSEAALAKATGLAFAPPGRSISHGGLNIMVFQTSTLA